MRKETYSCLVLSLLPGLGIRRVHRLLETVGGPDELLDLSASALKRLRLNPDALKMLRTGAVFKKADILARHLPDQSIVVISPFDPEYPSLLREIYDPPLVLYIRGRTRVLSRPAVAVVGSRRCSVYGQRVSRTLGRDLSACGLSVVSGLARGIDSEAHRGALEGGGATLAVLGSGVDVIYPREHERLAEVICRRGCVVSEFPCGSYPAPQNFPIRNRIISGLSLGTVIAEASEFSGSLITARLTLEQDRELWAVPGNITSKGSYGPNYLIKQGASPVMEAQDILDALPVAVLDKLRVPSSIDEGSRESEAEREEPAVEARRVLELLPPDDSVDFDRIMHLSGLEIGRLNALLLSLEMGGWIRQMPGRRYARRV